MNRRPKETLASEERAKAEAIEADVDAMLAYVREGEASEAAFRLREIRKRYLPDTIAAYEAIPTKLRSATRIDGASSRSEFLAQLETIHAAFSLICSTIKAERDGALRANGAFLRTLGAAGANDERDGSPAAPREAFATDFLPRRPCDIVARRAGSLSAEAIEEFKKTRYAKDGIQRPMTPVEQAADWLPVSTGAAAMATCALSQFCHGVASLQAFLSGTGLAVLAGFATMLAALPITFVLFARLSNPTALAWMVASAQPAVAPGAPRTPEQKALMETRTYRNALKAFAEGIDASIDAAVENARKRRRDVEEAGCFV